MQTIKSHFVCGDLLNQVASSNTALIFSCSLLTLLWLTFWEVYFLQSVSGNTLEITVNVSETSWHNMRVITQYSHNDLSMTTFKEICSYMLIYAMIVQYTRYFMFNEYLRPNHSLCIYISGRPWRAIVQCCISLWEVLPHLPERFSLNLCNIISKDLQLPDAYNHPNHQQGRLSWSPWFTFVLNDHPHQIRQHHS